MYELKRFGSREKLIMGALAEVHFQIGGQLMRIDLKQKAEESRRRLVLPSLRKVVAELGVTLRKQLFLGGAWS